MKTVDRIISAAVACAAFFELMAVPAAAEEKQTITVSSQNLTVSFSGWGTGLYRWSEALGNDPAATYNASQLLYGNNGLRMNIIRYNAGGGDAPSHEHFVDENAEIPGWWTSSVNDDGDTVFKFNGNADKKQRNVLKSAAEAAGSSALVEIYSFSPPYYMTNSGCTAGAVYSGDSNLRNDRVGDYALYLENIAASINDSGIKVSSIAPMNEPSSLHWKAFSTRREGCHIDSGDMQSRLLISLRDILNKNGMGQVRISACDEADPAAAIASYNALSRQARGMIDRITVHSSDSAYTDTFSELVKDKADIWITDTEGHYTAGENAGEMSAALGLSKHIISDLSDTSASAWVMWQAVDLQKPDLEHVYNGLVYADTDSGEIMLSQRYYAFGQFSRYIRPSSSLIQVDENTIAAYDNTLKELTVVAVNDIDRTVQTDINIEGFDILKSGSISKYRTSGDIMNGEHWKAAAGEEKLGSSGFTTELAPNSVTTYVIDGVYMRPDGKIGDINSDGTINVTDVSMTAANVKSLKAFGIPQQVLADVNGDGMINVTDISLLAAHVKGMRELIPVLPYTAEDIISDDETSTDEETTSG